MTSPNFGLGDWMADPAANELHHRSGRRVHCEARAMKVLELLHERSAAVVSTDEILERVWGRTVVSPHSVAIVISDLRKLLGDAAKSPRYIETVPKRGYRLVTNPLPGIELARAPRRRSRATVLLGVASLAAALLAVAIFGVQGGSSENVRPPVDPGLQEKFFQARQLWSRREHEDVREALRLLEEVIAGNDDFAPAHAALADIYAHKTGEELGLPALDTWRAAQRHLDRALALDPARAEPQVTQALLDFYRDHQPRKALASLDIALDRDPKLALAWQTRGMVLSAIGDHAGSLEAIEHARALDPLSASIGWDHVWFLYLAEQPGQALVELERASEHSPRNYLYEALIEQARGHERRALELWLRRFESRQVELPDPAAIRTLADRSLPEAYAELLRQAQGVETYREYPGLIAAWQLLSGDENAALAILSGDAENWMQIWLQEMPVFAPLRKHPRMLAIAAAAGITDAAYERPDE